MSDHPFPRHRNNNRNGERLKYSVKFSVFLQFTIQFLVRSRSRYYIRCQSALSMTQLCISLDRLVMMYAGQQVNVGNDVNSCRVGYEEFRTRTCIRQSTSSLNFSQFRVRNFQQNCWVAEIEFWLNEIDARDFERSLSRVSSGCCWWKLQYTLLVEREWKNVIKWTSLAVTNCKRDVRA